MIRKGISKNINLKMKWIQESVNGIIAIQKESQSNKNKM
jgi:hypothetical protein